MRSPGRGTRAGWSSAPSSTPKSPPASTGSRISTTRFPRLTLSGRRFPTRPDSWRARLSLLIAVEVDNVDPHSRISMSALMRRCAGTDCFQEMWPGTAHISRRSNWWPRHPELSWDDIVGAPSAPNMQLGQLDLAGHEQAPPDRRLVVRATQPACLATASDAALAASGSPKYSLDTTERSSPSR